MVQNGGFRGVESKRGVESGGRGGGVRRGGGEAVTSRGRHLLVSQGPADGSRNPGPRLRRRAGEGSQAAADAGAGSGWWPWSPGPAAGGSRPGSAHLARRAGPPSDGFVGIRLPVYLRGWGGKPGLVFHLLNGVRVCDDSEVYMLLT